MLQQQATAAHPLMSQLPVHVTDLLWSAVYLLQLASPHLAHD